VEGSGSLEFGIGNQQVKMPYRYLEQSNFLTWIKRKFELGLNYNNLSDYDKQKLKNHILKQSLKMVIIYFLVVRQRESLKIY
jgi:hypothetical protein